MKKLTLAAAAYLLLSIALTWPIASHLTTHLPHDLGDPLYSSWLLWWNAHVMPFTAEWWNGQGFFPIERSLAFSDHRVGLSLIGTPVQWLGGNGIAAYNVALILSFALSALGAHALVLVLTGRHDTAALAGVIFGCNPYRFQRIVHLEISSSYWMPVALLGLHLWLRTRQKKWLVLFGGAWLLQALTCGYYLFMFSVLVGLWILWFIRPREWRTHLVPLAVTLVLSVLPLVPVLWQYKDVHDAFDLQRSINEVEFYSADVTGLLSGSPWLSKWPAIRALDKPEGHLFPGITGVLVVLAAALSGWLARPRGQWHPLRRALLALVILLSGVAASSLVIGPWRLGGLSVSHAYKPLSLAIVALVAHVASSPAFVSAFRRRSIFAFYAVATLCFWALAFGPTVRVLGQRVFYKAPYAWLMELPGFDQSLRVPARFGMVATLTLAVAAGVGLARLLGRRGRNASPPASQRMLTPAAITAALVVVALAEVWPALFPLVAAPRAFTLPPLGKDRHAVLELPLGVGDDILAMYHASHHRQPLINGWGGHYPPHYAILRLAIEQRDVGVFDVLARRTPLLIAVPQGSRHGKSPDEDYVEEHPAVQSLGRVDGVAFYRRDRSTGHAPTATGPGVPIRRVVPNRAPGLAPRLLDGRLDTIWASDVPQHAGEQMTIELERPARVCEINLALGRMLAGFPRLLEVSVSADGATWTPSWKGQTAALAVEGALIDPLRIDVKIPLSPTGDIRFVRLEQRGTDAKYEWAMAELGVVGCR